MRDWGGEFVENIGEWGVVKKAGWLCHHGVGVCDNMPPQIPVKSTTLLLGASGSFYLRGKLGSQFSLIHWGS